MIRNLLILGFAACLTGISRCDKDFDFRNTAYDNLDVDDEYQGALRMHYDDYDQLDINENRAQLNRNAESTKDTEKEHPPYNSTSSEKGGTTTSQPTKKVQEVVETSPANEMNPTTTGPKTNKTMQSTTTKPGTISTSGVNTNPPSTNGSHMKLPGLSKKDPKRRLVTILYYLYNKFSISIILLIGDSLHVQVDLPKFQPNSDVFFMLPGYMESQQPFYGQKDYVEDFFKSISSALLPYSNCTIIGVHWSFRPLRQSKPYIQYRAAVIAGRKLGKAINEMKGDAHNVSFTIIGHDLGNMAAASLAGELKRPLDYIYGLDQRLLHGHHRDFYLRQDLGKLVQTLTTNDMHYNYGHRNFYPNGGNFSKEFGPKDDCFLCHSYQFLSDEMTQNCQDHSSTFCMSYEDYVNDYCENLPQVSYYNRYPASQLPIGNYFITEPVNQNQI